MQKFPFRGRTVCLFIFMMSSPRMNCRYDAIYSIMKWWRTLNFENCFDLLIEVMGKLDLVGKLLFYGYRPQRWSPCGGSFCAGAAGRTLKNEYPWSGRPSGLSAWNSSVVKLLSETRSEFISQKSWASKRTSTGCRKIKSFGGHLLTGRQCSGCLYHKQALLHLWSHAGWAKLRFTSTCGDVGGNNLSTWMKCCDYGEFSGGKINDSSVPKPLARL